MKQVDIYLSFNSVLRNVERFLSTVRSGQGEDTGAFQRAAQRSGKISPPGCQQPVFMWGSRNVRLKLEKLTTHGQRRSRPISEDVDLSDMLTTACSQVQHDEGILISESSAGLYNRAGLDNRSWSEISV